jgi:quercetin dioxygenase-like cupin family protein
MLTVEFSPDEVGSIHRHNAHMFVYMLEGSIVMQVRGGKEETLGPGQSFYESPTDIHVVGKNASASKAAKFLVVFIKNKGAQPVLPAE